MIKWKSFNISMPKELLPIYDFLQNELNFFLSNHADDLSMIDLTQKRGDVWREMNTLFKYRIDQWKIHNKAWHARIVFENIRRILESQRERKEIYAILERYDFQIHDDLRDELIQNDLYPTKALLKNMIRSKKIPSLPNNAVFCLDYSASDKQMFFMDQDGLCYIKVSKKEWIDYQIAIPVWVNPQLTGHIAKPRFIRRKKDNQYIGICSYEYAPLENNNTGILGVDIGKLKFYSAVAIDEHENHSDEFIHSKKLQKQKESLDRLNKEYSILYHKKRSYERLRYQSEKTIRMIDNYFTVKNKITRVKADQARLIADEIVRLALELKCKEIHLENLSWLENKVKKWQFAAIQEKILEQAEEFSIKIVRVNAYNSSKMHPITKEAGTVQGRSVKFKQESLDRDFVAAINLAGRNKGSRKERPVSKIKKVRTIRTKIKSNKREIRKKVNQLKGKNQIVFFLPNVGSKGNPSLTVWPIQLGLSRKISFLQKLSKTDGFW